MATVLKEATGVATHQPGTAAPKDASQLSRGWLKIAGIAGLISAVILGVGTSVLSASNNLSDESTATQISQYIASNTQPVLWLTVMVVAGTSIGFIFNLTIARLVTERDHRTALGTLVLGFAAAGTLVSWLAAVNMNVITFLVKQDPATNGSVIHALFDLGNGLVMPGLFGFAICGFLVASGIAMIRGVFAAQWVGWLSVVLGILSAAGAVAALTSPDGGMSPLGMSPLIGYAVFVVIASIFLLRERRGPQMS